jgi:CubicO group peptidase (beta-lactamase class C family)
VHYSREKLTAALSADRTPEEIDEIDRRFQEFDAWIATRIPAPHMPSFTASFVYKNRVLYQRAINAEIGRQYPVVSFTKLFTATCVLRLAGQQKLSLDESVQGILPGYLVADGAMTVRNLLTHSSGFLDDGKYVSTPGTVFRYSNHNYRLLGEVIRTVASRPAHEFMSQEIVDPLEMRNTTVPVSMNGAVGLYTSSLDMSRFLILHINHGHFGPRGIYNPALFSEIPKAAAPLPKSCADVEYRGIGWRVVKHGERFYLMDHLALWNGIGGYTAIFPEQETGFVYMSDPPYYQDGNFLRTHWDIIDRLSEIAGVVGRMDPLPQAVKPCKTEDVHW